MISRTKYNKVKRQLDNMRNKYLYLKEERKKLYNSIPNTDFLDDIDNEREHFEYTIKTLQDKIVQLERELLLKDGKISQLEDAKKELRERYNELREDYRWLRDKPGG